MVTNIAAFVIREKLDKIEPFFVLLALMDLVLLSSNLLCYVVQRMPRIKCLMLQTQNIFLRLTSSELGN